MGRRGTGRSALRGAGRIARRGASAALIALLAALACAPARAATPAATLQATQKVLATEMAQAGRFSGAYVIDLATGAPLYSLAPDRRRAPASVEKLYTSATALLRLGPAGHLSTEVLAPAAPDALGVVHGNLVLRGGGDPTFGHLQAAALAAFLAEHGVTSVTGRVLGDESAFDLLRGPPSSGYATSIYVGPLSALSYDEGLTGKRHPLFQARPAAFAAAGFTAALKAAGVHVARKARAGLAPVGAVTLASWDSPPLASVLARMNQPSDNYMAETLIKGLGAQFGGAGTTAAGAAVVRSTLAPLHVRPWVVDGSGLSRADRTSPRQVVRLLKAMARRSDLAAPFAASLPVAGRSGTLVHRMRHSSAQGRCQAKTGTLSDVSALAGYCTTAAGEQVAFAFLMNGVSPYWARKLQDRMAIALTRYEGLQTAAQAAR